MIFLQVRTALSDFSVLIGILFATALDFFFELDTPKLNVPQKLQVSFRIKL